MRIIVCIKELTDYPIERQGTVRRRPAGIVVRVNPQDLVALGEALSLREKIGGEVIVLSLGTDERTLRRALTMGADGAILVEKNEEEQEDWHTTSLVLPQAASRIGFDLILCGTWRLDNMDSAVGVGIAEHLGIAVVTHAVKIEVTGEDARTLQVHKRLPKGMREIYKVPLPCVIAVEEGLNQPRYVPIWGRCYRQGLTKSVEHIAISELGITSEILSPKTTILEVSEMRPRTRLGVKVSGLSLEDKLRLLMGEIAKPSDKQELIVHEPERAAKKFLEKLSEWHSERKT